MDEMTLKDIINLSKRIIIPIEKNNFAGWDLFDGLNSRSFNRTIFNRSRILRLLWIQFFKKSPVNFRRIAQVPKGHNAKGLSLIIKGYVNLYKISHEEEYLKKAYSLAEIIINQRSKNHPYFCVGYNFHWEARAFTVQPFTPNMIVSSFVAQAFLDLYELDNNSSWLTYATDIGHFIKNDLLLFESEDELCFGYIPNESVRVHNANLMGARLMARLYLLTNNKIYKQLAVKSVNYSCNSQRKDGAWIYGEKKHHQWVDNFHTGFNLVAINDVQQYLETNRWCKNIESGMTFHEKYHFLDDMTPKYYDTQLYPIDIHNFAQGIDTFCVFGAEAKAEKLLNICMLLMFDKKKKYFYYQKNKFFSNKNNYIRWAQSWMFYALTKHALRKSNNIRK
jgi:hypothetical protein